MNRIHKKRLTIIILFIIGISFCVWLILYALRQNINLFYYPKDVCQKNVPINKLVYLGGFVSSGSLSETNKTDSVVFFIADKKCKVKVVYTGILPELFKPGREAVVKGKLNSNHVFTAKEVLAKHDNKYKPESSKQQQIEES